jgi:hypothetical protein
MKLKTKKKTHKKANDKAYKSKKGWLILNILTKRITQEF